MASDGTSISDTLRHAHDHGISASAHEERTRVVVVLTTAMMTGELIVGSLTNSLALVADGWHMATHAGTLGMAALAYWFARKHSKASVFTFGTGKVHALAGYTNAIALAVVAVWMIYESSERLVHPLPIAFGEALPIAVVGLLVNLVSMKLLHVEHPHDHEHEDAHDHEHEHSHDHEHDGEDADPAHRHDGDGPHHGDHNLRAAYVHVLSDAFTSVLAIVALIGGRYLGWRRLDPLMGIVGGAVIARWSYALCRSAARQLLDAVPSMDLATRVRGHLEGVPGTEVVDLHIWEIGPKARACIASVVAAQPRTPIEYAEKIRRAEDLAHVTIEVHRAAG